MIKYFIIIISLFMVIPARAETVAVGISPEATAAEALGPGAVSEVTDFIYYDCIPLPEELQHYIWNSCKKIGLDYCLALAIMEQESTFRQYAKHSNNNGSVDRGLWQINSSNIKELKKAGIITSTDDLFDVYKCTDAAMWELAPYVEKFGNCEQLYTAYNTGRTNIKSNRNSRKVIQLWKIWKERLYGEEN